MFSLPLKGMQLYYQHKSGIEISRGIPKIGWIAMGTMKDANSLRADGWYNEWQVRNYLDVHCDSDKFVEISKKQIKENFSMFYKNPKYALKFFYTKLSTQWNNPTYQSLWIINEKSNSKFVKSVHSGILSKIFYAYANYYQLMIYIGCLLFLILLQKKLDCNNMFLMIIIIGGFFFSIVWEAKSQYVFQYFVFF